MPTRFQVLQYALPPGCRRSGRLLQSKRQTTPDCPRDARRSNSSRRRAAPNRQRIAAANEHRKPGRRGHRPHPRLRPAGKTQPAKPSHRAGRRGMWRQNRAEPGTIPDHDRVADGRGQIRNPCFDHRFIVQRVVRQRKGEAITTITDAASRKRIDIVGRATAFHRISADQQLDDEGCRDRPDRKRSPENVRSWVHCDDVSRRS